MLPGELLRESTTQPCERTAPLHDQLCNVVWVNFERDGETESCQV